MKKYIIFIIIFMPFLNVFALFKQDKIKAAWESKDGFYYLKLGAGDGLMNGSILIGANNDKKPFFIEILGILGPHYSLFQKIGFSWDNNENKINKNYLDKADLDSKLEISEIYDNYDQMYISKFKEAEELYKNAKANYDKKRFNLSKKYFEECLAIVDNYKDSMEILNDLNNDLKKYKAKPELNEDVWRKSMEQVDKHKSEDNLKEALSILQKIALDYPLSKKIRNELGLFYNEMGYIYLNNEYFNDAINEMEELLFLDPGAFSIRRELAFIYYYQGDKEKAMEHFEKLFSMSKDESAVELRNLINKLLLISSQQVNNSVKGMCSLCLNSISGSGTRFSNGLLLCDNCNEGQVHNKQDVKNYLKKIENIFVERFKMKIRNIKDLIPDTEFGIKEISYANDKELPFVFLKPVYTEYEVHYIDSLPRILIIEGLTSEYIRLWFEEQNMPCLNLKNEEEKRGIEMYFKYVMLNHFLLREQIGRFIYQNNSASLGFRRIKAIVEAKGEGKLVEAIKRCFEQ